MNIPIGNIHYGLTLLFQLLQFSLLLLKLISEESHSFLLCLQLPFQLQDYLALGSRCLFAYF